MNITKGVLKKKKKKPKRFYNWIEVTVHWGFWSFLFKKYQIWAPGWNVWDEPTLSRSYLQWSLQRKKEGPGKKEIVCPKRWYVFPPVISLLVMVITLLWKEKRFPFCFMVLMNRSPFMLLQSCFRVWAFCFQSS